jgi:hypothetical protein
MNFDTTRLYSVLKKRFFKLGKNVYNFGTLTRFTEAVAMN